MTAQTHLYWDDHPSKARRTCQDDGAGAAISGPDLGIYVFLPLDMDSKKHTIELDEATVTALETRAAERGVSVSQIVSELVPLAVDNDDVAELDRRWAKIKAGEPTVSQQDVERWLQTWGTPEFKPWRDQ